MGEALEPADEKSRAHPKPSTLDPRPSTLPHLCDELVEHILLGPPQHEWLQNKLKSLELLTIHPRSLALGAALNVLITVEANGLGFQVQGLGFRVEANGLGFQVQYRVWGSGLRNRVSCLGYRV
jgi:hypothetical protein